MWNQYQKLPSRQYKKSTRLFMLLYNRLFEDCMSRDVFSFSDVSDLVSGQTKVLFFKEKKVCIKEWNNKHVKGPETTVG